MAATKLTGTKFKIGYSNSNGSRNGILKTWKPDISFPKGADTAVTERPYLLNLFTPAEFNEAGEFPPHSRICLTIDIAGSGDVILDPSTILEIPCRQMMLDDGTLTEDTLTIESFVDFSSPVTLRPGVDINKFYYNLSSIEVIRLGNPSDSSNNMNNSTVLIAPMQTV